MNIGCVAAIEHLWTHLRAFPVPTRRRDSSRTATIEHAMQLLHGVQRVRLRLKNTYEGRVNRPASATPRWADHQMRAATIRVEPLSPDDEHVHRAARCNMRRVVATRKAPSAIRYPSCIGALAPVLEPASAPDLHFVSRRTRSRSGTPENAQPPPDPRGCPSGTAAPELDSARCSRPRTVDEIALPALSFSVPTLGFIFAGYACGSGAAAVVSRGGTDYAADAQGDEGYLHRSLHDGLRFPRDLRRLVRSLPPPRRQRARRSDCADASPHRGHDAANLLPSTAEN
jgi:hypothetical protein